MKKRILLSAFAIVAIGIGIVGMSAYEAHIINVTATIENALNVPIEPINFGTVFPQEELNGQVAIALSSSFLAAERVDDVNYLIKQKPKCALNEGITEPLPPYGLVTEVNGEFVCVDSANYHILPLLCPYLSKHDADPEDNNDSHLDAFHGPITVGPSGWNPLTTESLAVPGHLARSESDIADLWTIDLKVPCFAGMCAQDWTDYVSRVNPGAIAANYIQPVINEHKLFGCDLWIEVSGISEPPKPVTVVTDTWSVVDTDSEGGGPGKEWFAKSRINNPNFELAVGTNDATPGGQNTNEAVWVSGQEESFTLSYDGAGNATLAVVNHPSTSFFVGAGTFGRIGLTAKARNGADKTTAVSNLVFSLGAVSPDNISVTNGMKSLTISGVNMSNAWTLSGKFIFTWTTYTAQEDQAIQFSID